MKDRHFFVSYVANNGKINGHCIWTGQVVNVKILHETISEQLKKENYFDNLIIVCLNEIFD